MGKNKKTIYDYFENYSRLQIDNALSDLTQSEKAIITDKYGCDLDSFITSDNWNQEEAYIFYKKIVPKIRKLLQNDILYEKRIKKDLKEMLKEEKSSFEICQEFNLSRKELYEELLKLKNMGILTSRKYYSDGTIKYKNISEIIELNKYNTMNVNKSETIITDKEENVLQLLVISDLHFGNKLDRLDLIDKAYNYCIKNSINIILCCGDLIDGSFTKGEQYITDLYKQLEYFIEKYPFDKNILTFAVGGNHDYSALTKSSLNIVELCNNYRHDVIIGGYSNTLVNLKNDKILMHHDIENMKLKNFFKEAKIIFQGHFHKFSFEMNNDKVYICVPTLSNIMQIHPSALEITLYFTNGFINNISLKNISFDSSYSILSQTNINGLGFKKDKKNKIENVEPYKSLNKEKILKI